MLLQTNIDGNIAAGQTDAYVIFGDVNIITGRLEEDFILKFKIELQILLDNTINQMM